MGRLEAEEAYVRRVGLIRYDMTGPWIGLVLKFLRSWTYRIETSDFLDDFTYYLM